MSNCCREIQKLIAQYAELHNRDPESVLSSLLTDLRFWAETEGYSYSLADQVASDRYAKAKHEQTEKKKLHAANPVDAKIASICMWKEPVVVFAVTTNRIQYPYKSDSILRKTAIRGQCKIIRRPNDGWTITGYDSGVMINPNWLTVALCADSMIRITGDDHHVFLEGLQYLHTNANGTKVYEFVMGS